MNGSDIIFGNGTDSGIVFFNAFMDGSANPYPGPGVFVPISFTVATAVIHLLASTGAGR